MTGKVYGKCGHEIVGIHMVFMDNHDGGAYLNAGEDFHSEFQDCPDCEAAKKKEARE